METYYINILKEKNGITLDRLYKVSQSRLIRFKDHADNKSESKVVDRMIDTKHHTLDNVMYFSDGKFIQVLYHNINK
jgi:hypothetical protein